MTTLYKYRFLIENNEEYVYEWLENIPSTFNGSAVVSNSITILDTITDELPTVKIEKENVKTGGHYQSMFLNIEATANTTTSKDVSWAMPISLFSGQINIPTECIGDEIEAVVSPDTVIGIVQQNVSQNVNVIYVSTSVLDNVFLGMEVTISDGNNNDKLGKIINIDYEDNSITLEKLTTHSFSSGSNILINLYLVSKSKISNSGLFIVGRSEIAGQYFPAGRVLRVNYYNNSLINKNISIYLEYLY